MGGRATIEDCWSPQTQSASCVGYMWVVAPHSTRDTVGYLVSHQFILGPSLSSLQEVCFVVPRASKPRAAATCELSRSSMIVEPQQYCSLALSRALPFREGGDGRTIAPFS
eukprot:scaffold151124_cov55-Attheya_sp.AAC.1